MIRRILAVCNPSAYNGGTKRGGTPMKLIFKILSVPIILVIDLFTLVCTGLISFSELLESSAYSFWLHIP